VTGGWNGGKGLVGGKDACAFSNSGEDKRGDNLFLAQKQEFSCIRRTKGGVGKSGVGGNVYYIEPYPRAGKVCSCVSKTLWGGATRRGTNSSI